MSAPEFSLLTKRRFGPVFATQFLGAFNDNLFKTAMLMLASYGLYRADQDKAEMLATIATGLFILPYFLFSSLAGQIADVCDKARLARIVKTAEIAIMAIGYAGFTAESVPLLLGALFLMGVHSTLFGPIKDSILPQHLKEKRDHGRYRHGRGGDISRYPRRLASRRRHGAGKCRAGRLPANSPMFR